MPVANDEIRRQRSQLASKVKPLDVSQFIEKIPQPPPELSEEAVNYWIFYCSFLIQGRSLKRIYVVTIHNLCLLHVLRAEYIKQINEEGVLIDDNFVNKEGYVVARRKHNPICRELSDVMMKMDRLLASLGMTAYTDKVLAYDSSGGQITKGKEMGPPAFIPEESTPVDSPTQT